MSTVTTTRRIDLARLGFPASMRGAGPPWEVEADQPQAVLQAAVDACPLDNRLENRTALHAQVAESLTVLRTSVDTLQAITDKPNNQITPADTKSVARESRRIARQVLAISRLIVDALNSADTGTA